MWAKNKYTNGFTIVELLIVIVVIGILAAITIVAYNGVQNKARTSAVTSQLTQAAKKIAVWQVDNPGLAPMALADAGIASTNNVDFQLTSNNTVTPSTYCVTATYGALTYYIDNASSVPTVGTCAGYNLLAWNEAQSGAATPIPTAITDMTVFRSSTSSLRLGPSSTGRELRGNPYNGTPGQVYTVSMWVRSDSNWDGLSNNSKIRFGDANTSALLTACGYGGAKISWTQVTCSFTLTAGSPSVAITVGNDGSVGNIWIDDLTLSRTN